MNVSSVHSDEFATWSRRFEMDQNDNRVGCSLWWRVMGLDVTRDVSTSVIEINDRRLFSSV